MKSKGEPFRPISVTATDGGYSIPEQRDADAKSELNELIVFTLFEGFDAWSEALRRVVPCS